MVRVFVEDISSIKNDEKFHSIFKLLPDYRKNKILSFKFNQNKYLSLLAGKLLQDGFKEFGLEGQDKNIQEDENGKPFIPGNPIYFSISHSGTKVMVVFSDHDVGCDIQIIKNDDISLADHFFTKDECEEIKNSLSPVTTFYKMWTLKESYMKVTGKGLSLGLKNIHVNGCKINDDNYVSYFYDVDSLYLASYVIKK